jgi:SAM-dependent methyltransferase
MSRERFDPATFPLEADLSRADVRVLYSLCRNKSVVEFGCGGSTVLLANFAASVVSYDTSQDWIERTKYRLAQEKKHACRGIYWYSSVPAPSEMPRADVYFIDGVPDLRAQWVSAVIERRLAETIIIHDSRSQIMDSIASCFTYPAVLSLRTLEYHADGSNLLVIRLGQPVVYENWNLTETEARLPHLPPRSL